MTELIDWQGRVSGHRPTEPPALSVSLIMSAGGISFSSPFRVQASDGNEYFVKAQSILPDQHKGSLAAELVVARLGALIQAPVVETTTIWIPEALNGYEIRPGMFLSSGVAHASAIVPSAVEERGQLQHRHQDSNRERHVGFLALFDLCLGADAQWLFDMSDDFATYSHDHGLFLNMFAPGTAALFQAVGDQSHEFADSGEALSRSAVESMADRIERLNVATIEAILRSVPSEWPVQNEDLEALGWFIENRATGVAIRLRARATTEVTT